MNPELHVLQGVFLELLDVHLQHQFILWGNSFCSRVEQPIDFLKEIFAQLQDFSSLRLVVFRSSPVNPLAVRQLQQLAHESLQPGVDRQSRAVVGKMFGLYPPEFLRQLAFREIPPSNLVLLIT